MVEAGINSYEEFIKHTIVSADTGDVNLVKKLKPLDSTTNPTLILKSVADYKEFLVDAIKYSTEKLNTTDKESKALLDLIISKICVNFGAAILEHIDGVVSTEVDARLSYDTEASILKAREIVQLYEEINIPKSRILIKLCATWEGIIAAEQLEKEGIHCNLTLIFNKVQAIACAQRGITLISPFVGRINDSYKKLTGIDYKSHEEPGVLFVKDVFNYLKNKDHGIIIMGASLRTPESCYELAGCDKLTIPPPIIEAMKADTTPVQKKLSVEEAKSLDIQFIDANKENFEESLKADTISSELLKNGINAFINDAIKLEAVIKEHL